MVLGRIYSLIHTDGRYYVGSTILAIEKRFQLHRSNNMVTPFKDEWESVRVMLIMESEFQSKQDLLQMEQDMIELCEDDELCINKHNAVNPLTRREEAKKFYKNNPEKFQAYRESRREEAKEYARQYREDQKAGIQHTGTPRGRLERISKKYNVTHRTISLIDEGKAWKHVTSDEATQPHAD